MYVIFSVLLILLGLFLLLLPEAAYELFESWKHRGAEEPSDLYLIHLRIGGAVLLLVGLAGAVFFLFFA